MVVLGFLARVRVRVREGGAHLDHARVEALVRGGERLEDLDPDLARAWLRGRGSGHGEG